MKKRALIGAGVLVLVVCVGLVGFVLRFGPGSSDERYAQVTSIEEEGTYQDEALLAEAWALPAASRYGGVGEVRFQSDGSRCGPASVANILGSLGDEDDTEEEVLDGTGYCWTGMCIPGLTLDEVADIARQNTDEGVRVRVVRDLDLPGFREELRASNDPRRRVLINFHRGPLFGRAGGHHSPIAGYLEERDLVLVVDVNQEYRPWLVSSERLFEAMDTVDSETGDKRGMLVIEAGG